MKSTKEIDGELLKFHLALLLSRFLARERNTDTSKSERPARYPYCIRSCANEDKATTTEEDTGVTRRSPRGMKEERSAEGSTRDERNGRKSC